MKIKTLNTLKPLATHVPTLLHVSPTCKIEEAEGGFLVTWITNTLQGMPTTRYYVVYPSNIVSVEYEAPVKAEVKK